MKRAPLLTDIEDFTGHTAYRREVRRLWWQAAFWFLLFFSAGFLLKSCG